MNNGIYNTLVSAQAILNFIQRSDFEIVVLIEGTESVTSNKLQARFSYAASDILTNFAFAPCVVEGEDGCALVDFEKFHQLVPLDEHTVEQDSLFMQSIL